MQISALITLIKQRRQEIAEGLVNGNCANFESYQRLVGQSLGLAEALQMINNLLDEERKDVK
jgi:hypothetical protein|tara:strand:- start:5091 stop:5276 length:186 start_codon:yes stop_codon:yes gene_type:complete